MYYSLVIDCGTNVYVGIHRLRTKCHISLLTLSRSGAAGHEDGSNDVCTPPPGQRRMPGRWWPTLLWPRSPLSPWGTLSPTAATLQDDKSPITDWLIVRA